MQISRPDVLNAILALYDDPRYLEVGVANGTTFHELTAKRKTAVEPKFRFDVAEAQTANPGAVYHEVLSDEYFGSIAKPDDMYDVIYLDGLHTAEQTLRDLINAVTFLKPDGVIVIDDVYPANYAASLPELAVFRKVREGLKITRGAWMGDVYRLVFFVETFFQQFSYHTIRNNHGQLVMWRAPRKEVPRRDIDAVGSLQYSDCFISEAAFRFAQFDDILATLKARGPAEKSAAAAAA